MESRTDFVVVGDRLFGYFPMSTEPVMAPSRVTVASFTDGVEHRAALPSVYNRYMRCGADPGCDPDLEAEQ